MNLERYSRQLDIPCVGEEGQERLANSAALVIGTGGLGSTLLFCLAGAGVGTIGFMDGDVVSLSNLNRQFLHTERDLGRRKTDSALEKLRAFNPTLLYIPIHDMVTKENADKYIKDFDVVILAVDSIPPRFVVNDACCRQLKPLVNGGVDGMTGMVNLIVPGETPCLRCLYEEQMIPGRHPTSFAPVVSAISALEAQLALLVLLGKAPLPFDKELLFCGEDVSWHAVSIMRNPGCETCGNIHVETEQTEGI